MITKTDILIIENNIIKAEKIKLKINPAEDYFSYLEKYIKDRKQYLNKNKVGKKN